MKAVGLYSIRQPDDLLVATLQIAQLQSGRRYQTKSFRATIVNQLGTSEPRATRMSGETVYRATATKQTIAIWFRGQHMFLLTVRQDFNRPRALIREALQVSP